MRLSYSDRFSMIISLLLDAKQFLSVDDISSCLQISKRNVYYTLKDINALLSRNKEAEIASIYGKGLRLSDRQKCFLRQYQQKINGMDVHSLTQSERNSLLYCELY